jgi:hypothetical protein
MDVILAQGHTRFSGEGEVPLPDEGRLRRDSPDRKGRRAQKRERRKERAESYRLIIVPMQVL